jgi:P27 family predicted phage terminase small subunit
MGKGRKPKPPGVRLMTGVRSRSGYCKNSPMPDVCAPEPPSDLEGFALSHWHFLLPRLLACKVLTEIDGSVLEVACRSYARYRVAEAMIAKDGAVQSDANLVLRKSPWVAISHEASAEYLKCSALLGLSPADRARLQVPNNDKQVDEFEAFQQQA